MLKTPLMSHQVKVGAYYYSLCYHAVPLSLNCSCMLTLELRVILQSCSNLHTVHSHTDITDVPIVLPRSIQDLKRNLRCVMEMIKKYMFL